MRKAAEKAARRRAAEIEAEQRASEVPEAADEKSVTCDKCRKRGWVCTWPKNDPSNPTKAKSCKIGRAHV